MTNTSRQNMPRDVAAISVGSHRPRCARRLNVAFDVHVNLLERRRSLMTRRDRNAEATRHVILEAAREIFSQHPYSDVSGMQICDHAGVTRGALQHHFGSKVGVFMAVFEDLQQGVYLQTVEAIGQQRQPWEKLRAGIAAFLDACTQPAYQTVVLIEGPAAIGWERWRELDAEYYGNLAQGFATMLAPAGSSEYASAML